jgi:hypothetical protein
MRAKQKDIIFEVILWKGSKRVLYYKSSNRMEAIDIMLQWGDEFGSKPEYRIESRQASWKSIAMGED